MYKARKFVQESYDRNDAWGRKLITEMLDARGYNVLDKPEDFGIDIVAERNGVVEFFEVEVKHNYPWNNRDDFKFDTVSFLGRKKKWEEDNFWYCIICAETEAIIVCRSSIIYNEEFAEIRNINTSERKGKDKFYRVPKEKCWFINMNMFRDGEDIGTED
jgi:hypothetical protein